ncbi:hypothetical protein AQJ43_01165 [Streptomyces avermitilis]|uniref:Uncharacterized protein n=1 Tax=Streptomyces avermitilis TaxID=33903 RepID=A0A4D4LXP1_STRAX|nr:hypothetical protein AQJ43_01165 [Streptomyces avermitilis]BBJ50876.1 hypothetical protein SAVMC3_35050 [Streptomyces avermitilis]GDY62903.1 hypothetical protein SAV14893_022960 [Streptomyces avermitilis]GDY76974.1 hypothetical protein SAV31267_064590 [Streptomyces avermitilis]GDY85886.1 hypothetical protein SAVCW2_50850 [Streptomyces avermitilis]
MVSMNALMDNLAGILTVLVIFVVLALPALIGLAHERRIDRQLREAAGRSHREAGPPQRPQAFVTTTVTVHS